MKIIVTIVVAIIVFNTSKSEAQKVFINADKNIYKSNDTIKLKIINKSLTDLVYVVGLEVNFNNKWVEIESDVSMMGMKIENWKPIKKGQIIINKIRLPDYIIKIIMKDKNKIRFRMKYGLMFNKTRQVYSNIIKI